VKIQIDLRSVVFSLSILTAETLRTDFLDFWIERQLSRRVGAAVS